MTTVGLFGTCGNSTWRERFIDEYNRSGIDCFNPQVDNWSPELALVENDHLARDEIILFPVLEETLGYGSLGETGFSIAHALRVNRLRFFVFLVDPICTAAGATPAQIKESERMRQLIRTKLMDEARNNFNVFFVHTLDEMLVLSKALVEWYDQMVFLKGSYS